MTVAIRKKYVAGTILLLLCLANMNVFVNWLYAIGLIPWAQRVCDEYLTGTAITVIVAILVIVPSGSAVATCIHRCRVCDAVLLRRGKLLPRLRQPHLSESPLITREFLQSARVAHSSSSNQRPSTVQ